MSLDRLDPDQGVGNERRMIQKLRGWGRLFSEFAATQVASQLIAAVTGLLVVRHMSVREFGLYTLALSTMGFAALVSDGGITGAMMFFYRDCLRLGRRYEPFVLAALRLRRYLLFATWIAIAVYVFSTASHVGYAVHEQVAALLLLYVATWNQAHSAVGMALLRLKQRFRPCYEAELLGNVLKLVAVALFVWSRTLQAWSALVAAALGATATRVRTSRHMRLATSGQDGDHEAVKGIERRFLRYIAPTTPGTVYFAMQAPLLVWLCGHFGDASVMAQVGAVGRLGALLALVNGFVSAVLLPRLASITDDARYLRQYMLGWAAMGATGAMMLIAAMSFPEEFVWLLGDSYRNVEDLVPIVTLTAIAAGWTGYAAAIKHARGWVRNQPFAIVLLVAIQIGLIRSIDLSNARGALLFQLGSVLAILCIDVANNVLGFRRSPLVALESEMRNNP